jgi:hypothetical protein
MLMKTPLFSWCRAYRAPLSLVLCYCLLGSTGLASADDAPPENPPSTSREVPQATREEEPVEQLPPSAEVPQYSVPSDLPDVPESPEAVEPASQLPAVSAPPALSPAPIPSPEPALSPGTAGSPAMVIPGPIIYPDVPVPPRAEPPVELLACIETLRQAVQRLKLPLPLPEGRIVVFKAQRRLELWNGSTLVRIYRTALGPNPNGQKQRKYDGRTPEGQYYICMRNATTSNFRIFLGLSYPALHDAKRGVQSRAISWREYQVISQRLASRGTPLWSTELGGWVGIHGGTNNIYAQRLIRERGSNDWTAGCIAVTDAEIDEIHAATRLGTPVLVKP